MTCWVVLEAVAMGGTRSSCLDPSSFSRIPG